MKKCGDSLNGHDEKSKSKCRFLVSTDIETGLDEAKVRTSREAPVEVEYLYRYIPCLYTQPVPSASPSTVSKHVSKGGRSNQALVDEQSITSSSAPLGQSKSESMVGLSKSESCHDDTLPPPMIVAASTSATEEDEESIGRQASCVLPEKRSHTDPFAPRVGKTLSWRNINMTLVSSDNLSRSGARV